MREAPHILIVEDNDADAKLLTRAFDARGWTWARVSSLSAAMRTIDSRFTVVVADLGLPDAGGAESVEALHRASEADLIACSATMDEDAVRTAARSARGYIDKGQERFAANVAELIHSWGEIDAKKKGWWRL